MNIEDGAKIIRNVFGVPLYRCLVIKNWYDKDLKTWSEAELMQLNHECCETLRDSDDKKLRLICSTVTSRITNVRIKRWEDKNYPKKPRSK